MHGRTVLRWFLQITLPLHAQFATELFFERNSDWRWFAGFAVLSTVYLCLATEWRARWPA